MGRIGLFFLVFNLSVLYLSAQSGYSNLEFVENKGQWDTAVKFRAQMSAGDFFLRNGGYSVFLHDTGDLRRIYRYLHTGAATAVGGKGAAGNVAGAAADKGRPVVEPNHTLHSHFYNVNFEHANPRPEIVPEKALLSYNNYLRGDPSHWASQVKLFLGVTFKNVYDGIDVHYYTNEGILKYDIIVHPGADPSRIVLQYAGVDQLSIKKGQLLVKTSVSTVRELEPRAYQVDDKGRTSVPCSYVIRDGNHVTFSIKDHSPDATLVIDPTEIFCSFTGSRSDNWGYTSTFDNAGNFYAGGIVVAGNLNPNNFGATPGAFQTSFQGGDGSEGVIVDGSGAVRGKFDFDVAIMKFNSSGSRVVYATYLGGGGDEQPHSMICDAQGNLIITGRTTSGNNGTEKFPTFPSAAGTHQGAGFDLFVTKLNATGTALIGSQRIGGSGDDGVNFAPKYVDNINNGGTRELRLNYGDDGRGEVILDAAGNIFVATCTKSTDFPMAGNFQGYGGGDQDGIILKLSSDATTLLASSYFGGSSSDGLFSIAQRPGTSTFYVSGGTMSTDLRNTSGTIGTALHGGSGVDGVVALIQDNGSSLSLIKSAYIGTSSTDMVYGVQVDAQGFPYIMGTTYGVITPVNSPFNAGGNQATGKQFITKLQPDLSAVIYSANFGKGGTYPNISPTAFLVDRCENVYVSGWGGVVDKEEDYLNDGTSGLVPTPGAMQTSTDGSDFYFFVLQRNAASQLYGSFFGQNGGAFGDHVDGGTSRFDKEGVIYQSVCANCYGPAGIFPTTSGVVSSRNGTGTAACNEAAVKIAFNFAGISGGLKLSLKGRGDSLGCVPLTVTLQDTVRRAKNYIWNFGDGGGDTATTDYAVTHTYTAVGVYRVMMVAIDSNSCNVADTSYKTITVKDNRAILDFSYDMVRPCGSLTYNFHNLSQIAGTAPPFSDTSFKWMFEGQIVPAGPVTSITPYKFLSEGTKNVSLILTDTNYCNAPDTLARQLFIAMNVVAGISTPDSGCAPYYAHFDNTSLGGQTYLWDFGDGTTSTDRVPPDHLYPNPGQYTIKLKVWDPATCNKVDSTSVPILLQAKPSGDFTWSPDPPQPNTPTVFTPVNISPDVVKWEWLFGDGASTIKTSQDTVVHQYQRTDTFHACMVVFNRAGCSDTVCHPVSALINPLLDVPNAFTPGRFGQNAIVKVMGFGIVHMNFRIYNRWGQMVFQSTDPNIGWDGYYKGTMQPMDVYAYTLEAEYFDGSRTSKKGDITLIR